jgi:hypothetical protein
VPDVGNRQITGTCSTAEIAARGEDITGTRDDQRLEVGIVVHRCTARLIPKYMAGVNAFLASGRSIVHHPITPSRSNLSPAAPRSSVMLPSLSSDNVLVAGTA